MTQVQLQVTPASEWKKTTIIAELPSGRVAELQRISPIQMVMEDGSIPDELYGYMIQAANGTLNDEQIQNDPVALKAFFTLQIKVVYAAFVNPKVVPENPNREAGEIALVDVDDIDKQFVANWAMQGGDEKAALKRFRDEQARIVAAASKKQNVPPKTKQRTRD
jgi:hypothetical protein